MDQTGSSLIKLALDANERHLSNLDDHVARLSAQLAEADALIAAAEAPTSKQEPLRPDEDEEDPLPQELEKIVFMPGSSVFQSLLSQADITSPESPFYPDVEQRKRYLQYTSPPIPNWPDKERRSLLQAVVSDNKRIHALACQARGEDPLQSVLALPDSAFEYNTVGLNWQRIAAMVLDRSPQECKVQWLGSSHPSINNSEWPAEELKRLGELVETAKGTGSEKKAVDWVDIAKRLQTRRIPMDCMRQWMFNHAPKKPHSWTPEEDAALMEAVKHLGTNNWSLVAVTISPHLDSKQCHERYSKTLLPTIARGRWTDEQDEALRNAVQLHGKNWEKVSVAVPGRTNAQCRERWVNILDPDLKRGPWTEEEDASLLELVTKHGEKWTLIAAECEGRTDNMCRRRWLRLGVLQSKGVSTQQEKPPPKKKNPPATKNKKGEIPDTAPLTTILRMTPAPESGPSTAPSNGFIESAGAAAVFMAETISVTAEAGTSKRKKAPTKNAKNATQSISAQVEAMDLDDGTAVEPTPAPKKKARPKPKPAAKPTLASKEATTSSTTDTTGSTPMVIEGERALGGADVASVDRGEHTLLRRSRPTVGRLEVEHLLILLPTMVQTVRFGQVSGSQQQCNDSETVGNIIQSSIYAYGSAEP